MCKNVDYFQSLLSISLLCSFVLIHNVFVEASLWHVFYFLVHLLYVSTCTCVGETLFASANIRLTNYST